MFATLCASTTCVVELASTSACRRAHAGRPHPIALVTALTRLDLYFQAHKRLRPHLKLPRSIVNDARSFTKSPQVVDQFKLKPPREASKRWDTLKNFLDLAQACLTDGAHAFRNARERVQFPFLISLVLFGGVRPGDVALAAGYTLAEFGLQYKDASLFFTIVPNETKARLNIRNGKDAKSNPDDDREVALVSRDELPPAVDPTDLFAMLGNIDVALKDGASRSLVDGVGLTRADLDLTTGTWLAGKVKKERLPVFGITGASPRQSAPVPRE